MRDNEEIRYRLEQLEFNLKYGFFTLRGNAIQLAMLLIIEHRKLAELTNEERMGNRVFVKDIYAWYFKQKGVNDDSIAVCQALAMVRVEKKLQAFYNRLERKPQQIEFDYPTNIG
jgi:hypothetical protein